MKLITPPTASVPYTAEAPSRSTSTRSIAESGMLFRSTAFAEALNPPTLPKAWLARRRPFSSTSVELAPMPRRFALDTAYPTPCVVSEYIAVLAVMRLRMSSTWWPPIRSMSLRVMMVTGSAVSPSMRLMLEPVTSTRSCVATCCCRDRHRDGQSRRHGMAHLAHFVNILVAPSGIVGFFKLFTVLFLDCGPMIVLSRVSAANPG